MWTLDRNSPIPLYKQIEMVLRNEILVGNLPKDSILPSEQEFCSKFDVSRITIRKALDELTRDGLVLRQQGKGTIVLNQRKRITPDRIKGFSRSIRDENTTVHSEILSIDLIFGDSVLLKTFNLPTNKNHQFYRFRRLRYVNNIPCVVLTSIVRKEIGEKMQEFDLREASFYALIETIMGLNIIRNESTFVPVIATPELCTLLKVEVGSPHFFYRGISYVDGDIPVELASGYFHGNKFELFVTIPKMKMVK